MVNAADFLTENQLAMAATLYLVVVKSGYLGRINFSYQIDQTEACHYT